MDVRENKFWIVLAVTNSDLPHVGDLVNEFSTRPEAMDYARGLAMEVQGTYYVMKAECVVCSVLGDPEEGTLK